MANLRLSTLSLVSGTHQGGIRYSHLGRAAITGARQTEATTVEAAVLPYLLTDSCRDVSSTIEENHTNQDCPIPLG